METIQGLQLLASGSLKDINLSRCLVGLDKGVSR